jgi:hypothetical protein
MRYYASIQDVLNNRSQEKFEFINPNYIVTHGLASWGNWVFAVA